MDFPYEYGSDLHWLWGWGHRINTRLQQVDNEFHQWDLCIFRPDISARKAMTKFSVGYPYAIKVIDDGLTFTEKMFAAFLADPKEADTFGMALIDLSERITTSVKVIADGEAAKNSTLAEPNSKTKATPRNEFFPKSDSLVNAGIDAVELSKVCFKIERVCNVIELGEWTSGLKGMIDDVYAEGGTCRKLSAWGFDAAFRINDNELRHYLDTLSNSICDLHLQNAPSFKEGVTLHWHRDMQKVDKAVRDIRACVSALDSWIAEVEPPKTSGPASKSEQRAEWLAKAMILVREHPDWSDAEIARKVHRNPGTLSRSREFQAAAAMARGDKADRPKGHITVDPQSGLRDVEAYSDDPAERDWDT